MAAVVYKSVRVDAQFPRFVGSAEKRDVMMSEPLSVLNHPARSAPPNSGLLHG